jgi:hypothetical protein
MAEEGEEGRKRVGGKARSAGERRQGRGDRGE